MLLYFFFIQSYMSCGFALAIARNYFSMSLFVSVAVLRVLNGLWSFAYSSVYCLIVFHMSSVVIAIHLSFGRPTRFPFFFGVPDGSVLGVPRVPP